MSFFGNIENVIGSWFHGNNKPSINAVKNLGTKSKMMSRTEAALNGDFDTATQSPQDPQAPQSFENGGPVNRTDIYKLHKGEYVVNKKKVDLAKRMIKTSDTEKKYSRQDPENNRALFTMTEGTYKNRNGNYELDETPKRGVVYD